MDIELFQSAVVHRLKFIRLQTVPANTVNTVANTELDKIVIFEAKYKKFQRFFFFFEVFLKYHS